jgi:hypothetical protein
MESHDAHVLGHGAAQEAAARGAGRFRREIEPVLPFGALEVQRMHGRVAHIEQTLTFG